MSAGSTRAKVAARDKARQRRAELDAERARRDEAVEVAAAGFFEAADERTDLLRQVSTIEARMTAAIGTLVELGESAERISALLDIDAAELRRLRPRATSKAAPAAERRTS